MTLANIAIYLALIVSVVARRMTGHPVGPARKLLALPVIAIVIGWGDATRGGPAARASWAAEPL